MKGLYFDLLPVASITPILGNTTVAFQESDVLGSGYANIAAADLLGGANDVVIDDPAEDDVVIARAYVGAKRYVRILFTQTGTHTNGTPISALVIKGVPRHAPVA